jgi:thiamine biosynthesis protein ThiI
LVTLLLRLGELTLKKGSQVFFEKVLRRNIQSRLVGIDYQLLKRDTRYYLQVNHDHDLPRVEHVLATTFGLVDFHRAVVCNKNQVAMQQAAIEACQPYAQQKYTFKVETRRVDKSYVHDSYQVSAILGHELSEHYPHFQVDVRQPQLVVFVEIREKVYVYVRMQPEKLAGQGLPVGTAGHAMLMLSGGIDSPVAGWMMARRGLQLSAVHFHTPPYTGDEVLLKVRKLVHRLAAWNTGCLNFYYVNFTKIQLKIRSLDQEGYTTILSRICMNRIAGLLAQKDDISLLVTGDALAQVSSQTSESLQVVSAMTPSLILRPCLGMDKNEIIALAQRIGSFDISKEEGADCCSLFAPAHPVVRPNLEIVRTLYEQGEFDDLIVEAATLAVQHNICEQDEIDDTVWPVH